MGIRQIGRGSLGGKGQGIGFFLERSDPGKLLDLFAPHRITVPDTAVVATGFFDEFVDRAGLSGAIDLEDDREVAAAFLGAALPDVLMAELDAYLERVDGPIAVRSSALNEDALTHPFAGLFLTRFLPNVHADRRERLRRLSRAVRLVYASTYFQGPKAYTRNHGLSIENERMAVLLQPVVGRRHGDVFYPDVAGVAQSRNFFPVGYLGSEDGLAFAALGLGKAVVEGRSSMRFCPRYPLVRPQFHSIADILRNAQRDFMAVSLAEAPEGEPEVWGPGEDASGLVTLPIEAAEAHGTLDGLADTYVREEGIVVPGMLRPGLRVLTLDPLLREETFPLPSALRALVAENERGFGTPVDVEFALTFGRDGTGDLTFLQVRPMAAADPDEAVATPDVPDDRVLIRSTNAMGHGVIGGLRHLVWVDAEGLSADLGTAVSNEIAEVNRSLFAIGEAFVLVGPGRWGSANRDLGIPVTYAQISAARVIVEVAPPGRGIQPSQGTHFFRNVASGRVHYLAVDPERGDRLGDPGALGLRLVREGNHVRHFEADAHGGLVSVVDGLARSGVVYVPA